MNFGMTNTPATFVTIMNNAFRKQLGRNVFIYLDDVVVLSKNEEVCIEDLRETFQTLRDNKLLAKPSKCNFFKQKLVFLVISFQKMVFFRTQIRLRLLGCYLHLLIGLSSGPS